MHSDGARLRPHIPQGNKHLRGSLSEDGTGQIDLDEMIYMLNWLSMEL